MPELEAFRRAGIPVYRIMVSNDASRRMTVVFSGRVQGVGFRFTACRMASMYEITGYVKNLMDGDVELVAEGIEQELIDFLNSIRTSHLGRYIINEHVSWSAATGGYDIFGITYL